MAGALLSLLWCLAILLYTLYSRTPNVSLFPEIGIASKVAAESNIDGHRQPSPLAKLLSPLSNSVSSEIRKQLAGQMFVLYYPNVRGPPILGLRRPDVPLSRRRRSLE